MRPTRLGRDEPWAFLASRAPPASAGSVAVDPFFADRDAVDRGVRVEVEEL
jgi:hypothetical protein